MTPLRKPIYLTEREFYYFSSDERDLWFLWTFQEWKCAIWGFVEGCVWLPDHIYETGAGQVVPGTCTISKAMWHMVVGQGVENNKLYLLNMVQIIQTWNYAGLCLFVTACHISAGFSPLAWKAELPQELPLPGRQFIKLVCRKMNPSSPSDISVLAKTRWIWCCSGDNVVLAPGPFVGLQSLVYSFHLNFLCGHAVRHGSLSLWGHFLMSLSYCIKIWGKSSVNLLCCEKTTLPNMKLDAHVHWFLIFKEIWGTKGKIHSKLDIQTFRNWKICFCEYSSTNKSLSKNCYNSTYWKSKCFPRVKWVVSGPVFWASCFRK